MDRLNNKRIWIIFALLLTLGLASALGASYYSAKRLSCNTLVIDIKGDILTSFATGVVEDQSQRYVTYSDQVAKILEQLERSETIDAVILDIDSYGGLPVAGEEIANALKRTEKKNVALIRTAGLSAAYWAATGADHIVASPNSDVGSIGVSLQLRNFVEKNKKEGIRVTSITSGQYKGIGDPNRDLTKEEKELLQIDVDKIHENFVTAVSGNRSIEREQVAKLANGASMLGDKALEKGLIDELGDMQEAKAYLKKELGTEVRVCIPPPGQSAK